MHLYAEIVSINLADAKETLCALLDENTHKNERLGQYAFNIFEIIIDKLYANLNIRISTENDDFNDFPDITDNQKVYGFSIKMLEKYYIYLSEEETGILERMLEDCKRRKREYALEED